MATYYVNRQKQQNGDHEVHTQTCRFLPLPANRHPLGEHAGCRSAVIAARAVYPQSNGCIHCSTECHTS